MIQIASGEDALIFYKCRLEYIDENVFSISVPNTDKTYIFATNDIQMIGRGTFEKPTITNKTKDSVTGYS